MKRLLPQFQGDHSAFDHADKRLYDASDSIRESVNDVKFTLFLAMCLVVLVIFLVPAKSFGHRDSQHRAADVDHRHFRA